MSVSFITTCKEGSSPYWPQGYHEIRSIEVQEGEVIQVSPDGSETVHKAVEVEFVLGCAPLVLTYYLSSENFAQEIQELRQTLADLTRWIVITDSEKYGFQISSAGDEPAVT